MRGMKPLLVRIARGISCVLLPLGTAFLTETVFLVPEVISDDRPNAMPALVIMLLFATILFAVPLFIIWRTASPQGSNRNWRLIFVLLGIGIAPIAYLFLILSTG